MMKPILNSDQINQLHHGAMIAYPTESVYGLGCDPLNESAVRKLLNLKKRSIDKGLILIAADYQQLKPFITELSPVIMQNILKTWPGPVTWVFPASAYTPKWICGMYPTVAVRVTAHPLAKAICSAYGSALVSTSANLDGQIPARDVTTLKEIFTDQIDIIIEGKVGEREKPTEIRDVLTGKVLRLG